MSETNELDLESSDFPEAELGHVLRILGRTLSLRIDLYSGRQIMGSA